MGCGSYLSAVFGTLMFLVPGYLGAHLAAPALRVVAPDPFALPKRR